MSTSTEANAALEEVKSLTKTNLECIVWPVRTPRDKVSFLNEFANHIRTKFNEPSPSRYNKELSDFSSLRNVAMSTLSDYSLRDANSLKSLKLYYCQVSSILSRFRESGAKFIWGDAFGRSTTEGNLDFELNNIMFNIGAIHNELGSSSPKTNESNTREACMHFSSALWWVTELRDNRSGPKPKEMGHDLLTFFHHVLRAQAQECVLSHSIKSGTKLDNVAKLSAQIVSDYEIAEKLAMTPLYVDPVKEILTGALFQTWRSTVEFKRKYYYATSQLLLGLSFSDDNAKEIGVRVARLKAANQTLESAKPLIPRTLNPKNTGLAFETIDNLVRKKLDKAVRYNDNVYHSSIPSLDSLPQIESKLLISPAPFVMSSLPEFDDVFKNLVTIEAVQVNSIYSQKKDDLSRQISSQVSKQDEDLAQMISTLNIDKRNLRLSPFEPPDELIEICAELSMNPSIVDDVLTKLEELDDRSEEIQGLLEAVETMLKKRPNRQHEDELKRYKSTHEDALRTTQALHRQLYPELQRKIQLMATTMNPTELLPKVSETSAQDEEIIKKLEKLLDKVDEMKQQRSTLINQLRESLDQDDVIKHVVAAGSEHELKNIFDKEFQKHNKYLTPLISNLEVQSKMLEAIERANAQYGQVKLNHRAQKQAMKEQMEALKKFYDQFKATSEGIEEGLKYHNKMLELVRNFYAKVKTSNDLNDLLN